MQEGGPKKVGSVNGQVSFEKDPFENWWFLLWNPGNAHLSIHEWIDK